MTQPDPIFTQVLEIAALASQLSLPRFFHRFDNHSIEQLQAVNQALLDKVHRLRKVAILLIDLDTSHMDTYGQQESASYNTYYGTSGFHPLLTFRVFRFKQLAHA